MSCGIEKFTACRRLSAQISKAAMTELVLQALPELVGLAQDAAGTRLLRALSLMVHDNLRWGAT